MAPVQPRIVDENETWSSGRIPAAFSVVVERGDGGVRRALVGLLIVVAAFVLTGSCRPSEVQERQEEIREQRRIAADEAVTEKRLEEEERERTMVAAPSYREWFMHTMREPSLEPRNYENALEHVSLRGETLVLGLSVADTEAAIELCDISLKAWSEREKLGVSEIMVVFTGDGSTLAQSIHLSTGAHVCQ